MPQLPRVPPRLSGTPTSASALTGKGRGHATPPPHPHLLPRGRGGGDDGAHSPSARRRSPPQAVSSPQTKPPGALPLLCLPERGSPARPRPRRRPSSLPPGAGSRRAPLLSLSPQGHGRGHVPPPSPSPVPHSLPRRREGEGPGAPLSAGRAVWPLPSRLRLVRSRARLKRKSHLFG